MQNPDMDTPYKIVRPTSRNEADEALVLRGLRVLVGGPERAPGFPVRSWQSSCC